MCGHGTIGTITAAIESGLLTAKLPGKLIIDVPAGQINIEYQQTAGKVDWVKIFNVPAYLAHRDVILDIPELGPLKIDVSYGELLCHCRPTAKFPRP